MSRCADSQPSFTKPTLLPRPFHGRLADALSRRFREDHEEGALGQQAQRGAAVQPEQAPRHLQALKASGECGAPFSSSATQQPAAGATAGGSAAPQRQLTLRPASAAATRTQQFHVPYRLGSKPSAASGARASAESQPHRACCCRSPNSTACSSRRPNADPELSQK